MNKPILLVLLLFIAYGTSLGAERFQLVTELRTSYTGGAGSFSHYSYDDAGNRVTKRVFDGIDSLSALLSRLHYVYDAQNRVVLELLLGAAGDTLSMVSYTWSTDGMTSASTLRKDGTLRFKDSLVYAGGMLVEQRRYNGSLAMTFFHRYAYAQGLLTADSLFESDGAGGFTASASLLFTRNADSTVNTETQWRKTSAQWYCISTTVMAYTQKLLVSATKYETDGVAKRLMDSLAYEHDGYGNRIKETAFDNDRIKEYDIVYTWRDMQTGVVWHTVSPQAEMRLTYRNGRIELSAKSNGVVTLFRADGRRVFEGRLQNASVVALPGGLSNGRYIVSINGQINHKQLITIN